MKFQKGNIISEEHRKKISEASKKRKGEHRPPEARRKMSEAHKGKLLSEDHKKKIGESNKGRIVSKKTREKISAANKGHRGKIVSKEDREKLRQRISGSKNINWKGGITPVSHIIRTSGKFLEWRQRCLIRDNFTCQKCRRRGGDLNVHHKKLFSVLLKEAMKCLPLFAPYDAAMIYTPLWDEENGKTLCEKCHRKSKHKTVA